MSEKIQMVDLKSQYLKIEKEIDAAIKEVILETSFINGPKVKEFADNLVKYTGSKYVIPCANGTDALQIAIMALDIKRGDEVIVPAFTYVATAEVLGLLGVIPVMVDVNWDTFNIDVTKIEEAITDKTKAIVPVHLFGQSCDMDAIMEIAERYNLYVIEDNAQALGAVYTSKTGEKRYTSNIGTIGCTSFFPSKNLGCYGDGGAMFTNDEQLAEKLRMIANHGQKVKYYHDIIGCNSRLDTIQAVILDVKLKYLDEYSKVRGDAAKYYSDRLSEFDPAKKYFEIPTISDFSTHVFHQYTLKIKDGRRDELKEYLNKRDIPSMIYYPVPLSEQVAFKNITRQGSDLVNSVNLSECVLSLPIHTEMKKQLQNIIIDAIVEFYGK